MPAVRSHSVDALGSDLRSLGPLSRVFADKRRCLGLTQQHVAAAAGVSVQWLSGFENARGDFGILRIMRLAEVLGLSLAVHDRPETDIDRVLDSVHGGPQP